MQSDPQSMPAGVEVTVPPPTLLTVSRCWAMVNMAVTVVALLMVTTHGSAPEQPAPDQPAKVPLPVGVAVRVTWAPKLKLAAQVGPQSMPAGLEVTVPRALPALATVSVNWLSTKVAVTVAAPATETVQVPAPAQPPPSQPVKVEPAAAAANRVSVAPGSKVAAQVAPQSMPVGLEVTVPV